MLLKRIIQSPSSYFQRFKLISVGLYFDTFYKNIEIDKLKFALPNYGNDRAGRGLMYLNNYEKPERTLLNEAIKTNANVIELGACIGVISCLTNKKLQNPTNHIVVEANPLLIDTLVQNREKNKCKFKVINALISETLENDFYIGDSMVASSLVAQSNHKVKVKGISFENIEKEHNIKFDTLVMDIEGAEHQLLLSNKFFINSLETIFLENHPDILPQQKIDEYENFLQSLSFRKKIELAPITIWEKVKS